MNPKNWTDPLASIIMWKKSRIGGYHVIDFEDALLNLGHFLDVEYNHHRIHSALDYLTPAEFEARYEEQR